jgi:ATP-dependent Clp protease ATP-binding subunit ClpC
MFERFTDRARRVVVQAQQEAAQRGHNYIGTEHLLLGILHDADSVAAQALHALNADSDVLREDVDTTIPRGDATPSGHIPFTPRAKKILELSLRECQALRHDYIGTEHILLALLREGDGVAAQVLTRNGVTYELARHEVTRLVPLGEPRRRTVWPHPAPAEPSVRMSDPMQEILDQLRQISDRLNAIETRLGLADETPRDEPTDETGSQPAL